ncbi:MAG: hypothetical protein ACJA0Q_001465 [Saprospiraceae bacterium]|jgi:hypothetical protein
MKNDKAQKLYATIIKGLEKGKVDVDKITGQIDDLRVIAREIEDPLVLKTLRFIKEKLAAGETFELEIEEEEEEEEELEEGEDALELEVPEDQLLYLFQLLVDSDNKYNREEIKQYRAALQEDLY